MNVCVVRLSDLPGGKRFRCLGARDRRVAAMVAAAKSVFVEALRDETTGGTTLMLARLDLEGPECRPVIVAFDPLLDFCSDEPSTNGPNRGFELVESGLLQAQDDAKESRRKCRQIGDADHIAHHSLQYGSRRAGVLLNRCLVS